MAVTAKLYGSVVAKLANKEVDWVDDNVRVLLCTSAYVPDQDVHDYLNDISGEVAAGGGYSTGGAALTGKTVSYTTGTNTTAFSAANVAWPSSSITARYAVLYVSTGTTSTSALIGYVDFGVDVQSISGTFSITWDAAGIVSAVV